MTSYGGNRHGDVMTALVNDIGSGEMAKWQISSSDDSDYGMYQRDSVIDISALTSSVK